MTTKIANAHKVKVGRSIIKVGRIVNGPNRGHLIISLSRGKKLPETLFAIREQSFIAMVACYLRVTRLEKSATYNATTSS